MTYFNNINTLEELRKQYRDLLKKHHPDNANGSTEALPKMIFMKVSQKYNHNGIINGKDGIES